MSKFSLEEYTGALQALMPVGKVWPRAADGVQTAVLTAMAAELVQGDTDALALLKGAFPSTATLMLSEWESALGLPDDCAIGETDTIALRQNAVVTKLTSTGGQSKAYFIAQAKALGYTITIKEFRQARAGMSSAGCALNGGDWPFVMQVTAPSTTIKWSTVGTTFAGDPIRSWGNKLLECRLTAMAPSHIIIKFVYEAFTDYEDGPFYVNDWFTTLLDTASGNIPTQ